LKQALDAVTTIAAAGESIAALPSSK